MKLSKLCRLKMIFFWGGGGGGFKGLKAFNLALLIKQGKC